jgi:tetratricopeptide (TPR) repeat protein
LGEHRELRHGYFIYDATVQVPLIVTPPSGSMAHRIVSEEVRSIDIAPTILQLLGLPAGKMMQGTSLTGLMQGKAQELASDAYSETFYPRQFGWSALRSLRVQGLKYIDAPRPELYQLDRDPKELKNVAAERPAVAIVLKNKLAALEKSASNGGSPARAAQRLSPEEMERLARLGYLGNPSAGSDARSDTETLPDPKDNIDTFYLINRAGVDAGNGKCENAIPTLLEIIQKTAQIPAVYNMLGRCYFIQEKYPEAMTVFDQLRTIDPNSEDARFYTAACEFNLDQLDLAEVDFQKVLAVDPKRAFAHKYLGFIYQAQGKPDLAIAEFQRVLELSPQDLEAHGKLGFLLAGTSRLKEALSHFQKVVALSPSDASAHYNLGLAYEKLEDKTKAAQELALACKLDGTLCGK